MSEAILELKNVRKVFNTDIFKPKQVAIGDLSCAFPEGKCTGFLGHNGAGKTTAIRMIFGLLAPDKGKILFKGTPISIAQKGKLGYMPEVSKLPAALTPYEVLKYHLKIFNPDWLKRADQAPLIEETLKNVGIWDARRKKVKNLSKGMGRRLAWAQATIHDPELVILDEPFSGLDPVARRDLMRWIVEFKQKGKSLLLCTHEMWSVQKLCDEIHVLQNGTLQYSSLDKESQEVHGLFSGSHYTLAISGTSEAALVEIQKHQKLPDFLRLDQDRFLCKLHFSDYTAASQWLKVCLEQGMIVTKFTDEPSLDDEELMNMFLGRKLLQ